MMVRLLVLSVLLLVVRGTEGLSLRDRHHPRHRDSSEEESREERLPATRDDQDNAIENSPEGNAGQTSANDDQFLLWGRRTFQVMLNPDSGPSREHHDGRSRPRSTTLPTFRPSEIGTSGERRLHEGQDHHMTAIEFLLFSENGPKRDLIPLNRSDLRKDHCSMKSFPQVLEHPGCISKTIENHFCYGQCNSIYVPSYETKFICSVCSKSRSRTEVFELECPSYDDEEDTIVVQKSVEIVESCNCLPCTNLKNLIEG